MRKFESDFILWVAWLTTSPLISGAHLPADFRAHVPVPALISERTSLGNSQLISEITSPLISEFTSPLISERTSPLISEITSPLISKFTSPLFSGPQVPSR